MPYRRLTEKAAYRINKTRKSSVATKQLVSLRGGAQNFTTHFYAPIYHAEKENGLGVFT
jgi:hypothetical protein